MMEKSWKPAIKNPTVLLLSFRWGLDEPDVAISPGITMSGFEGSDAQRDYNKICFENGYDGGEPHEYESLISFQMDQLESLSMVYGDPYAVVERFCNILSITFSQPPFLSKYMQPYSYDNSPLHIEWLFPYGGQTEFLDRKHPTIDEYMLGTIRKIWDVADRYWHKEKAPGRLNTALVNYYYAWRAPYLEQTCINLGITLEVLFAPHSFSEATHQLTFNLAHFMGATSGERATLFKQTKDFYGIRSSIVHGGKTNQDKVVDYSIIMFNLASAILRRILSDDSLAVVFDSDRKRRALFKSYLIN